MKRKNEHRSPDTVPQTGFDAVVGINRRNVEYVFRHNQRKHFPLADSKRISKDFFAEFNLPHLPIIHHVDAHCLVAGLVEQLKFHNKFALKPERGYGGEGIIIIDGREGDGWKTVGGKYVSPAELRDHCVHILYGAYSLDSSMDAVLVEEKIEPDPFFEPLSTKGIPDIRIITYGGELAMGMLRLPTLRSQGKANLHAGGVGVGIDLETGTTVSAMSREGYIDKHPETGADLIGLTIPNWEEIVADTRRGAKELPLGYLGFDWVIDEIRGPLILEINARPGLEIQNVNRRGLRPILESITEKLAGRNR